MTTVYETDLANLTTISWRTPSASSTASRDLPGRIRRRLLGISPRETSFAVRGFPNPAPAARRHLQRAGRSFVRGYNTALACGDPDRLGRRLQAGNIFYRGFAFEGAAMALSIFDTITPWHRGRFDRFVAGAGRRHVYMLYVGAGWAMARLHRNLDRAVTRFDPLLRWLVADGAGFHQAYFHPQRYIVLQQRSRRVTGYTARAFDMGIGRALWFICGTAPREIANTIARFDRERHADLWSGIGLACTYAGIADDEALGQLQERAHGFEPQLAQGACFAAKARQLAGNPADHTENACRRLCGATADQAAAASDVALEQLGGDTADEPAFERWRRRLADRYSDREI